VLERGSVGHSQRRTLWKSRLGYRKYPAGPLIAERCNVVAHLTARAAIWHSVQM
jgi:hypothetical protein